MRFHEIKGDWKIWSLFVQFYGFRLITVIISRAAITLQCAFAQQEVWPEIYIVCSMSARILLQRVLECDNLNPIRELGKGLAFIFVNLPSNIPNLM